MTLRSTALPANCPPRLLRRDAAAEYVSVSPNKFDDLVKQGVMPAPKKMGGRVAWDRIMLDRAVDEMPVAGQDGGNPFDA